MIVFRVKLRSDWQERQEETFFTDFQKAKTLFEDAILEEANICSQNESDLEREQVEEFKDFAMRSIENNPNIGQTIQIRNTDIFLTLEPIYVEDED